jgi:hypothetical protein
MTTASIEEQARQRQITRLCHLTPARNLLHIVCEEALRSTKELSADERAAFEPQDLERLDGHPGHICCSIEYPNIWYLRSRRRVATPLQKLFPDWVCLLIDPSYLWTAGTLMCHRNAAASHGAYVASGLAAFDALFADPVISSRGPIGRDDKPDSCPTDDQAEVLIPRRIPLEHANCVVVADDAQARKVYAGLELVGAPIHKLSWMLAPDLFNVSLSNILRAGQIPLETTWDPEVMYGSNV